MIFAINDIATSIAQARALIEASGVVPSEAAQYDPHDDASFRSFNAFLALQDIATLEENVAFDAAYVDIGAPRDYLADIQAIFRFATLAAARKWRVLPMLPEGQEYDLMNPPDGPTFLTIEDAGKAMSMAGGDMVAIRVI